MEKKPFTSTKNLLHIIPVVQSVAQDHLCTGLSFNSSLWLAKYSNVFFSETACYSRVAKIHQNCFLKKLQVWLHRSSIWMIMGWLIIKFTFLWKLDIRSYWKILQTSPLGVSLREYIKINRRRCYRRSWHGIVPLFELSVYLFIVFFLNYFISFIYRVRVHISMHACTSRSYMVD